MNDSVTISNDTCVSDTRPLNTVEQVLITSFYALGIKGNILALVILARNETSRNKKQTLMLRCLAWNDLIALLGSLILMHLQSNLRVDDVTTTRCLCVFRVFWRIFGLGSGCVVVVMTIERCLALTRPFVYQRQVTYKRIKCCIFGLWFIAKILVCLPFVGFGLYFDEDCKKCVRYRNATNPKDIAYAYLVVVFGLMMCICIVCCNFAVVGVLCGVQKDSKNLNLVRIRRSTTKKKKPKNGPETIYQNDATQEEIAFAKLMAILSIFFVVCWFPQMLVVIIASMDPDKDRTYYRLADVCIALNFTLDPYVYVIFRRQQRRGLCRRLKRFCQNCCCIGSTSSRVGSDRVSEKNMFMVSENSKVSKGSHISGDIGNSFSSS